MATNTELLAQASALIDEFNTKKADIDAAVVAAISATMITKRAVYIDAINGNDNNNGNLLTPFQSFKKAVEVAQSGMILRIILLSNILKTDFSVIDNMSLIIDLNGFKLTVASVESEDPWDHSIGGVGFSHYYGIKAVNAYVFIVDYTENPKGVEMQNSVSPPSINKGGFLSWSDDGFSILRTRTIGDFILNNANLVLFGSSSGLNQVILRAHNISKSGDQPAINTSGSALSFTLRNITNDFTAVTLSEWGITGPNVISNLA